MADKSSKEQSCFTVGEKDVPFEIRLVPIAKLRYFEDNPRIFSIVAEKKIKGDQAAIENELWSLSTTHELFQDIKANGGLLEEVVVYDGMVLEGNRRLCAFRKLVETAGSEQEKQKWDDIRAKVITAKISQDDIFALLSILHIKGKSPWRPFEKAGFIHRMKHELGKSEEQICVMTNESRHAVDSMLRAYELMLENGVTNQEKFSYFYEYTKNPKFGALRAKDAMVEEAVITMIKEDRIPRAEAIRKLPEILSEKKAKKEFTQKKASFDEALTIAHRRNPELEDTFYRTLHQARERLKNAPLGQVVEDIKTDNAKKSKLAYFFKEVEKFKKEIRWDQVK